MCGIAGYSLSPRSDVSRTLAAQTLLAGIAERGADAVGYAYRNGVPTGNTGGALLRPASTSGGSTGQFRRSTGGARAPEGGTASGAFVEVHKQRSGASALLDQIAIPHAATQALVHVRDYTKGHPRIGANNHPVRHGAVVGIHNGIILNDEEIFAAHGFSREEPEMTVDSEAIFALAEESRSHVGALEELRGSMASAWMDERRAGVVYVARGVGRPLWLGLGRWEAFFCSTRLGLELLERYLGLSLDKRELTEGTLLALEDGSVTRSERFRPDDAFEEEPLPAVRAPQEGRRSLQRLAAIFAGLS